MSQSTDPLATCPSCKRCREWCGCETETAFVPFKRMEFRAEPHHPFKYGTFSGDGHYVYDDWGLRYETSRVEIRKP